MIKKYAIFMMGLVLLVFFSADLSAQIPGSVAQPLEEEALLTETVAFDETEPCPEPREALGNTPNDLKKIQEDITRFNLCLQRAQLLNRLNDLAVENIETINTTLDEKLIDAVGAMEIPELPVMPIAMPEISDSGIGVAAPDASQQPIFEEIPAPIAEWSVREVTGRGNDLVAVLVDDMDNLVRVKQGDKIPDTESRIDRITPTGVSVMSDGKVRELSWIN